MTDCAHPNSTTAQRTRLINRLKQGPLSTFDARTELDVMHPAARVQELREQGYHIETIWSLEQSPCGRLHRVARYVLHPGDDASRLLQHFQCMVRRVQQ